MPRAAAAGCLKTAGDERNRPAAPTVAPRPAPQGRAPRAGAPMTATAAMLGAGLVPLLGAVLALSIGRRAAPWVGVGAAFATALVGVALAVAVLQHGGPRIDLGGWEAPLGIVLQVDGLSAVMIALTGVIGAGVAAYAAAYFSRHANEHDDGPAQPHAAPQRNWLFWPLWLLCITGLNATYMAADLFHIYVTLELQGLAAVGLIALAGGAAVAAALRYLLLALTGSLLFVVGIVLLYAGYGALDIALLQQRILSGPAVALAGALMLAGLLAKAALFPLHSWLPPAHGGAPAPVSAALSALVVKSGFYLIARLWIELFGPLAPASAATLLGLLGAAGVLWGGVQALRQERLKPLIAYSTVAQVGYLFLLFPLAGEPGALVAVLLLAAAHAAAKAALFMCAGSLLATYGHDRIRGLDGFGARVPITVLAFALASISLVGLPPSGGFIAKWMLVEASLGSGQWWWAVLVVVGGLLSAAYLFRVLSCAFRDPSAESLPAHSLLGMQTVSLALALLSLGLAIAAPAIAALLNVDAPR